MSRVKWPKIIDLSKDGKKLKEKGIIIDFGLKELGLIKKEPDQKADKSEK